LEKRLLTAHKSDLGVSLFINDIFYWDVFGDKGVGHEKKRKEKKEKNYM